MPVVAPLLACIACLTAASAMVSQHEKEQRSRVMHLFSQHVSKDVAEELWRSRDDFLLDNRPRPVPLTASVVFTDLQGFTELSENMQPAELFDWLNEYMQAMSRAVVDNRGIVNKYIGDAVMGVFGVPIPRLTEAGIATDARNAVACALQMWSTLDSLNAKWTAEGKKTVRMRVGIFTGPLVAGCLGGADRLEYTVIGDTVNTAARLESAGKSIDLPQVKDRACCITIGHSTARLLGEEIRVIPVGSVELKGKSEKIRAYYVDGETPKEKTT
jgi:adenylate cyclase